MPEMDGFEVCRRLRNQPSTRHIPIIMLTGEDALDSRVQALDFGADDYVCKPFEYKELIARIHARLRRNQFYQKLEAEVQLGNLWMDPKSCQVRIAEQLVKLTQLEFDLLRYFLERPNQVVDRSRILADLWPDAIVAGSNCRTLTSLTSEGRSKTLPSRWKQFMARVTCCQEFYRLAERKNPLTGSTAESLRLITQTALPEGTDYFFD